MAKQEKSSGFSVSQREALSYVEPRLPAPPWTDDQWDWALYLYGFSPAPSPVKAEPIDAPSTSEPRDA